MESGTCDLHTHSNCSDGHDTPKEVVRKAKTAGLRAVALCDHNTVSGIPEFMAEADRLGIEAVSGVEISADFDNEEIHIVGLLIPEHSFDKLDVFLKDIRKTKERANKELFQRLVNAGYDISYEGVLSFSKDGNVNRVQFALELIRCGYIKSKDEAFGGILKEGNGFYFPTKRPDGLETIGFLHSLSIVPVLAHPLMSLKEEQLHKFLPSAKQMGLIAIETDYSEYDSKKTELARALADKYSLLRSGGSDYHGKNKQHIEIGIGTGNLKVPYEYLQKIKQEGNIL